MISESQLSKYSKLMWSLRQLTLNHTIPTFNDSKEKKKSFDNIIGQGEMLVTIIFLFP